MSDEMKELTEGIENSTSKDVSSTPTRKEPHSKVKIDMSVDDEQSSITCDFAMVIAAENIQSEEEDELVKAMLFLRGQYRTSTMLMLTGHFLHTVYERVKDDFQVPLGIEDLFNILMSGIEGSVDVDDEDTATEGDTPET